MVKSVQGPGPRHLLTAPKPTIIGVSSGVHEGYHHCSSKMFGLAIWYSSQILNSVPFVPLFALSVKVAWFYGSIVLYAVCLLCSCANKPGAPQLCWPGQCYLPSTLD